MGRKKKQPKIIFVCEKCGYSANADFNAAKNIALKDIERVIETSLGANCKQTA